MRKSQKETSQSKSLSLIGIARWLRARAACTTRPPPMDSFLFFFFLSFFLSWRVRRNSQQTLQLLDQELVWAKADVSMPGLYIKEREREAGPVFLLFASHSLYTFKLFSFSINIRRGNRKKEKNTSRQYEMFLYLMDV